MKAFVQNIEKEIRAKMVGTELCTPGCAIARVTAQVRGALALTVGQEVTPSPKVKNANEKEKEKGALLAAAHGAPIFYVLLPGGTISWSREPGARGGVFRWEAPATQAFVEQRERLVRERDACGR